MACSRRSWLMAQYHDSLDAFARDETTQVLARDRRTSEFVFLAAGQASVMGRDLAARDALDRLSRPVIDGGRAGGQQCTALAAHPGVPQPHEPRDRLTHVPRPRAHPCHIGGLGLPPKSRRLAPWLNAPIQGSVFLAETRSAIQAVSATDDR